MFLFPSSSSPRFKKYPAFAFYVFFCFFLLTLSPQAQQAFKRKFIVLFSPTHDIAVKIEQSIWEQRKKEISYEELLKENELLKKNLSQLTAEEPFWRELDRENKRLYRLFDFGREFHLELIPAKVIGRDPTNWNRVIFINKGENDGVKRNFPVVTPEGLVGQVIEVFPAKAKILTILDGNSRVAVLSESNRVQGIALGSNDYWCHFNYVSLREEIKEGEVVISSGLGDVFPKGLVIGSVESVAKKETDLFQKIRLLPRVNFSRLEEVMVVINK